MHGTNVKDLCKVQFNTHYNIRFKFNIADRYLQSVISKEHQVSGGGGAEFPDHALLSVTVRVRVRIKINPNPNTKPNPF